MIDQEDDYYGEDIYGVPAPPTVPAVSSNGPPYTTANPPPPPRDGFEWVLNPTTGQFEERSRGGGQNTPGYQDLDYWKNQGVPETDIFDPSTGQLRPGWKRTGNGYERTGGGESYAPPPDQRGGAGGGASAPPASSGFEWPSYQMPGYIDPGVFDPGPAFTFRDFVAPTAESMQHEPGFQFRLDQGRKALESSAAGKGVLRSGGTLKDILGYGQNFASQEYGNVYNRALNEYDTNRGNAADIWGKQYGQRKDVYGSQAENAGKRNTFNLSNAQFDWNSKYGPASQEFNDLFNRWAKEGDWLKDIAIGGAD
jgi:hypothetical protein